jgi:hypothetical protein
MQGNEGSEISPEPSHEQLLFERVNEGIALRNERALTPEGQQNLDRDFAELKGIYRNLRKNADNLGKDDLKFMYDLEAKFGGKPKPIGEVVQSDPNSIIRGRRKQESEQGR